MLEAAIAEFGQKGYEGASTTSIAKRADAHQPQINYHFSSKEDLWYAAVDRLFEKLDETIGEIDFDTDPAAGFALHIRRVSEFMHGQPELKQITRQIAAVDSERLRWVTDKHVRHRYERTKTVWSHLQEIGVAAPIDARLIHWVLIGAAGLPFSKAEEARLLLFEDDVQSAEMLEAHISGLVATLLPGHEALPRARKKGK